MEESVYQQMHKVEGRHWWFSSRRSMVEILLQKYLKENKNGLILDAGCGTGHILAGLNNIGRAFGIDLSEYALKFCRMNNPNRLCRSSIAELPFKNNSLDAVVCSDVLYHLMVEDDQQAIREIFRVCKKGGILLIFEPAFEWLKSPHDVVEHTRHRYTKDELSSKISRCGFIVMKSSYHIFFLFPLVLITRLFKGIFLSRQPQSDLYSLPPLLDRVLTYIMAVENRILRSIDFPLGSTVICLAIKQP